MLPGPESGIELGQPSLSKPSKSISLACLASGVLPAAGIECVKRVSERKREREKERKREKERERERERERGREREREEGERDR